MTAEDLVRRALTDDRHALPAWRDPVSRVSAGIRRRRRRRFAAAAVAGAVALVLAASAVLARPGPVNVAPPPADGVIPWLDAPAPRPTLARLDPLRVTGPACRAADLFRSAWIEDNGTGGGRHLWTVLVRNDGPLCTLSGTPSLRASGGGGRRITVPATPADFGPQEGGQYPATLKQYALGRFDLAVSCPSTATPLTDPAVLVGAVEVAVTALKLRDGCRVAVGDWYWLRPLVNAPLTVTLDAPERVRRGDTFSYVVTVLNAVGGVVDVPLRPCPVYRQTLRGIGQWYRLNCALSRFPPHRPVRFEMRMYVEPDAELGPARLSWMAVLGDGESATANLDTGGVTVEVTVQ